MGNLCHIVSTSWELESFCYQSKIQFASLDNIETLAFLVKHLNPGLHFLVALQGEVKCQRSAQSVGPCSCLTSCLCLLLTTRPFIVRWEWPASQLLCYGGGGGEKQLMRHSVFITLHYQPPLGSDFPTWQFSGARHSDPYYNFVNKN